VGHCRNDRPYIPDLNGTVTLLQCPQTAFEAAGKDEESLSGGLGAKAPRAACGGPPTDSHA
jgi:hypothetical protein